MIPFLHTIPTYLSCTTSTCINISKLEKKTKAGQHSESDQSPNLFLPQYNRWKGIPPFPADPGQWILLKAVEYGKGIQISVSPVIYHLTPVSDRDFRNRKNLLKAPDR